MKLRLCLLAALLAVSACGGGTPAPASPDTSAASAAPGYEGDEGKSERTDNRSRISTRTVLPPQATEAAGYGLYSYILIAHQTSDPEQRDLRLSLLRAYFELNPTDTSGVDPRRQNVVHALVTEVPPIDKQDSPEWILAHYDYSLSEQYISQLNLKLDGDGPVLVASEVPLHELTATTRLLCFDLSAVRPDVARIWIRTFVERTSVDDFWIKRTEWLSETRTVLSETTHAMMAVEEALKLLKRHLPDWASLSSANK